MSAAGVVIGRCSARSALFGSAALLTLVTAYRVGDFAAWRRLAVFAAVHALISAVLAVLAVR
jgi:hypothetical protein